MINLLKGLCTGLFFVLPSFQPVGAADPPALTFQPGPWQPAARINPQKPIQVTLQNQVNQLLEYGLTDPGAKTYEIPVGQKRTLSITRIPTFLTINTLERTALLFTLTVEGNQILIQVRQINDVVGDRTVNIDETGAIYIY
jgi:serine/threonine-protein kinase